MRYGLIGFAMVVVLALAAPASAHVVQATTSVSLTDVSIDDTPRFESVLRSAVAEVLAGTIAFTPTVVALTDARLVDDRLYLRLLIADEDGMRTLEALEALGESPRDDGAGSAVPRSPSDASGRTQL